MIHFRRFLTTFALLMSCCAYAQAQSAWEVTPYRIEVAWSLGNAPNLPANWREAFATQLQRELSVVFRGFGQVEVTAIPAGSPNYIDGVAKEMIWANSQKEKREKLFLVSVEGERSTYQLQVRELDVTLANLGPVFAAEVDSLPQVPGRLAHMITRTFSPLVRIDRYSDGIVTARLRAGALIRPQSTVGRLRPGELLLPFDRRVSSTGTATMKNIRPVGWTYLSVPDDVSNSSLVTLDVITGLNQPFRSKRNRRNQQLALRALPATNESTIRLQSKNGEPLIGYELHEKGQETTNFLGYTNWRGEFAVPSRQNQVRTLLVRNGERVIAKLPIVPGLREEVVARLVDNSKRVEADGFLSGVQNALVDLVATRESLTVRIRRLIKAGDLEKAEALLEEFRDLPTQDAFRRKIQLDLASLNVTDQRLRDQVDKMNADTARLLGKYIDRGRLQKLEAELAAATAQ